MGQPKSTTVKQGQLKRENTNTVEIQDTDENSRSLAMMTLKITRALESYNVYKILSKDTFI